MQRVYLMGYSMGGRTTTGFLAGNPNSGVAGYIGVGLWGGRQEPFNTNLNLRKVTIPVFGALLNMASGSFTRDSAQRRIGR